VVIRLGQPDLRNLTLSYPQLVNDDVVHHLPAVRARSVHPRPASREAVQCLLAEIFAEATIGPEERRQPQQVIAAFGNEFLESTFLLPIHLTSRLSHHSSRRDPGGSR
jgi:hypothetical protein